MPCGWANTERDSKDCDGHAWRAFEFQGQGTTEVRIGVVSDTHSHFRPRLRDLFSDVEMILHAGDIGSLRVIQELERIAPVIAVHGNMDRDLLWEKYPAMRVLRLQDQNVLLVHRVSDGLREITRRQATDSDEPIDVLIFGHTHRAECVKRDGVLHFNPGLGGMPRNYQTATAGIVTLEDGEVRGEILRLG